jgi:uncharacterized ion transporter superfamily protein YfcC
MLEELLKDPNKLGVVGILALIIVAFVREWIIPGPAYQQMKKERDEFKDMVIRQAETVDRALKVPERSVRTREK